METFLGIMIPFLGTTLGAACVFFMKKSLGDLVQRALAGFAAGVMVAASVWSLLIPAIEQSEGMGKLSFLPAFIGFWVGVLFLLLLDRLIPHLHVGSEQAEGPKSKLGRTTMMVLAVTLHNIPEGMAVGVVYAGFLSGNTKITAASALALSLGIAIQNFPEGAIISMPLRAEGESKSKAFLGGVLSGVVEPIGAVLTLLAAQLVIPALPYLLSFAAGMMLAVVCADLLTDAIQAGPGLSALPAASASVLAGCGGIWLLEELVSGLQAGAKRGGLFLAGVVMAAAIALHNLPEGMVIGASYAADLAEAGEDGRMMALVIGLHNIPEGMAVAVPLAAGGASRGRAVLTTAAAGAPTVLGAVLGFCLGTMGPGLQMLTLGGASGAMLYVVFGELLPESFRLCRSPAPVMAAVLGVLTGMGVVLG